MSTLRTNLLSDVAGTNSPDVTRGEFCRGRWNFDGTGTASFRDSFGISSLTDNAVGQFTMNFSVAQPNGNYTAIQTNRGTSSGTARGIGALFTHTVSAFGQETSFISSTGGAATLIDDVWNEGILFGDKS